MASQAENYRPPKSRKLFRKLSKAQLNAILREQLIQDIFGEGSMRLKKPRAKAKKRPKTRNGKRRRERKLYGKVPTQLSLQVRARDKPRVFAFRKRHEDEPGNDEHFEPFDITGIFTAMFENFISFLETLKAGTASIGSILDRYLWMRDDRSVFGFHNVCAANGVQAEPIVEAWESRWPQWIKDLGAQLDELEGLPPRTRDACFEAILADLTHRFHGSDKENS